MTHLIAAWDEMFTGSDCYMLSEDQSSIIDLARKMLREYISLWDDELDKERLVQKGLEHHHDCKGCADPLRPHHLGVCVKEYAFAEYGIDPDNFPDELAIDVRVLNLDGHDRLRDLCRSSPIMEPEKLLRSTDVDFRDRKFVSALANIMMYSE